MQTEILTALFAREAEVRVQWYRLLRLEPVSSPLAQPDTLVHLMASTLAEFFAAVPAWVPGAAAESTAGCAVPACPCGRNPYLAYFATGRQALREALVVAQADTAGLTAAARDASLRCVEEVFGAIARREIALFCSLCRLRTLAHPPRWQPVRPAGFRRPPPDGVLPGKRRAVRPRPAGKPG
jgi:hypothetical protein